MIKIRPLILALVFLVGPARAQDTLISFGSEWRYWKGDKAPSEEASQWRESDFNDSAWLTGAAPFGYRISAAQSGTVLADMQGSYTSLFLRRTFTVADIDSIGSVNAVAWVDDGAVIWINGIRLVNQNFPRNREPELLSTSGLADTPTPKVPHLLLNPDEFLVEGQNTIMVQAMNNAIGSSDFLFDLELTANPKLEGVPSVVSVNPPPGQVEYLDWIEVGFDRNVDGISPADILVNGVPAYYVEETGDYRYRFDFGPRPSGIYRVSWTPLHGITDAFNPYNEFSPVDTVYEYIVVDRHPPSIEKIEPQPGSKVWVLDYVKVWFTEPVVNVDPADLLVNGSPSRLVSGLGAGPYLFRMPPLLRPSDVKISWSANHGIGDRSIPSNLFNGVDWAYQLSAAGEPVPRIVINEFMAGNSSSLTDEDGDYEDWIELKNLEDQPINLAGWTLSDTVGQPILWTFPEATIAPGGFLVVFASGKDRRLTGGDARLHTNFSLSKNGEFLGLYAPGLPVTPVDEYQPVYPDQINGISYGKGRFGTRAYFVDPTPGAENGGSNLGGISQPVSFSVPHGIFQEPFQLQMTSPDPAAAILYTLDGTLPSEDNGLVFNPGSSIVISETTTIRAAAFREGYVPSEVATQSYLFISDPNMLTVPILSLVTDPANLYGETGILGIQGGEYVIRNNDPNETVWQAVRDTDYHNPSQTGRAWERPVSAEFLHPNNEKPNVQIDCGIRVHGSEFMRPKLRVDSKFGFRLHFRGEYGPTSFEFPLFDLSQVENFSSIVLRSGHNDPENPFISDEMMRRMFKNTGQLAPVGNFMHLFLNGEYRGYYNPVERINLEFLQEHFSKPNSAWDLIKPFVEVEEGTSDAINEIVATASSKPLEIPAYYKEMLAILNITNFADYILVNLYGDTGDWTFSNWRGFREAKPDGLFHYMIWDAEFSMGIYGRSESNNTIEDPRELQNTSRIANLFRALSASEEFQLLMADRFHKHFMNEGAMTNESILRVYNDLKSIVLPFIPGFRTYIEDRWIPNRTRYLIEHLNAVGMYRSDTAPVLNRMGGVAPEGFGLEMSAPEGGEIYYTTNGEDPRAAFTGSISADAVFHGGGSIRLDQALHIKARTLLEGRWSAMTEAEFELGAPVNSLVFSEIMYHPSGGNFYEFIELANQSDFPVDVSGYSLTGIDYTFPPGSVVAPRGLVLLVSNEDPSLFSQRYPSAVPFGFFGRQLSNAGERIELLDPSLQVVSSVVYDDENGWPVEADGQGFSLQAIRLDGNPNDPANWRLSSEVGGTPGYPDFGAPETSVVINELMAWNSSAVDAGNGSFTDWVEFHNPGAEPVDLSRWGFSNQGDRARLFVFPEGTRIEPGEYLVLWLSMSGAGPGSLTAPIDPDPYGGSLYLFNDRSALVDFLSYGIQIRDKSIGRNLLGAFVLNDPATPGRANVASPLGLQSGVRINEWLADALPGEADWIELYNPDPLPVSLSRLTLSNGRDFSQFKNLSYMDGRGFLWLEAGNGNPIKFKLPASGSVLLLQGQDGKAVDLLSYGIQQENVTEGRLPDGGSTIVRFADGGSPGLSNGLPDGLADLDGDLLPDAWELENGLDPDNPGDALLDSDGDGISNYGEYVSGTDPQDKLSLLSIQLTRSGELWVLGFRGAQGRGYRILLTHHLEVPWAVIHDFAPSQPGVLEYAIPEAVQGREGYFKVEPYLVPRSGSPEAP